MGRDHVVGGGVRDFVVFERKNAFCQFSNKKIGAANTTAVGAVWAQTRPTDSKTGPTDSNAHRRQGRQERIWPGPHHTVLHQCTTIYEIQVDVKGDFSAGGDKHAAG
jgi:hypothetical protein